KSESTFLSPRPSPSGRGRNALHLGQDRTLTLFRDLNETRVRSMNLPLPEGEGGVTGNKTHEPPSFIFLSAPGIPRCHPKLAPDVSARLKAPRPHGRLNKDSRSRTAH